MDSVRIENDLVVQSRDGFASITKERSYGRIFSKVGGMGLSYYVKWMSSQFNMRPSELLIDVKKWKNNQLKKEG